MIRKNDALDYHRLGRPGKLEVVPTKPLVTQRDLSLAYSPGVAEPCLEIAANPEMVWEYTARGNLVAVVTNGTAVLGLGNIGPLAGKPVMEGKACLFKKFADIDVYDLEVDARDSARFIDVVAALEPTFGGINLEDLKAPECFEIEAGLRARMAIPVFHDDQHGTAIISGAALLNGAEITGRKLAELKVVISGAGASAIACANFYVSLGVSLENITMIDSVGVIYAGREQGMNQWKARFARKDDGARTRADALRGADLFLGLSKAGLCTAEMLKTMAKQPLVFALANPDPEIGYAEAKAARPDAIVATGRSDFPNQVNNVLGFPYVFRGALDVRAKEINEAMKIAAAHALAALAHEPVPDSVAEAYDVSAFKFGPDYLIPKPFDTRVLWWCAPAVAEAAMKSGAARLTLDLDEYRERLQRRIGGTQHTIMRQIVQRAKSAPKRIVFPDGDNIKVLRACQIALDEKIALPILLGSERKIRQRAAELDLDLEGVEIINPPDSPQARRLRHRVPGAALPQGGDRLQRHPPRQPAHPLRHDDGAQRRRRRPGGRPDLALPRHHPSGSADPGHPPRRAARDRHVHDAAEERREVLRRRDRQHRSRRRDAGRHRDPGGRRRARLRGHAAHRDDLVLQLRLGAAPRIEEDGRGGRHRPRDCAPTWRSTARCRPTSRSSPRRCASSSRSRASPTRPTC